MGEGSRYNWHICITNGAYNGLIMIPPSRYDYEAMSIPFIIRVKDRVKEWREKTWEYIWPVLIFLLSPFLWIARLFLSIYVRVYIRFFAIRRASDRATCPACGIRMPHKMAYDGLFERLIHTCARCNADWPEAPVLPADKWRVARPDSLIQARRPDVPEIPWGTSSPEPVSMTTTNGSSTNGTVPKVEIKVN